MALAMIPGGLIGAERELADKRAGLRTHLATLRGARLIENRIRRARRSRATNSV